MLCCLLNVCCLVFCHLIKCLLNIIVLAFECVITYVFILGILMHARLEFYRLFLSTIFKCVLMKCIFTRQQLYCDICIPDFSSNKALCCTRVSGRCLGEDVT